jgi:hypothetical protein
MAIRPRATHSLPMAPPGRTGWPALFPINYTDPAQLCGFAILAKPSPQNPIRGLLGLPPDAGTSVNARRAIAQRWLRIRFDAFGYPKWHRSQKIHGRAFLSHRGALVEL